MPVTIPQVDPVLEQIRQIRTRENFTPKPSPFLRKSFINEFGEEQEVKIRNYQWQGVFNLLQLERMILGDDTGLGKTLEMLTAIGYIWMVEPDYVPIIVTTKSALFQWAAETERFMQGMSAVPVFGEPFERQVIYEDFFLRHDSTKKRLLLITYDTLMRDLETSVIKDRSIKAPTALKKQLKEARQMLREVEAKGKEEQTLFDARFNDRIFDVQEFIHDQMIPVPEGRPIPPTWDQDDWNALAAFKAMRQLIADKTKIVQDLDDQAAPPKQAPGILDHLRSLKLSHPNTKFMFVMDEMHKLKNHKSQFHQKCHTLSLECRRVYGMTATPVKNRLMEFWSLFRIIKPDMFPLISHFMNEFTITKLQSIGGGRKVPIVVGYKNLDEFVRRIELYYLSRKKHDVAKELPQLLSREIECELHDLQEELYDMAEAGLMQDMDDPDAETGQMLKSMTMIQQAVNSPKLLLNEDEVPFEGPSAKVDALLDLLLDEAEGQKVIVFSRFEKMISIIGQTLEETEYTDDSGRKKTGIKYVRITGKENDPKVREKAKNTFQNMNSGVNVILITTAGAESLNLQSAENFVFFDLPWSWGDYLQLIGRMIRIGSSYMTVVAHHLLARKQNGKKTIDHEVYKALKGKMKLADKVAGAALKGGLDFTDTEVVKDVMAMMRHGFTQHAGDRGTLLAEVNAKIASGSPKLKKPASKAQKARPKVQVKDDHPVAALDLDLSDLL
jgi:SNF2 family DNA or RNA helicase